jgi:hypothetical protein
LQPEKSLAAPGGTAKRRFFADGYEHPIFPQAAGAVGKTAK